MSEKAEVATFEVGNVVRFKRQDLTAYQVGGILVLAESGGFGVGQYIITHISDKEHGSREGEKSLRLAHARDGQPLIGSSGTGQWSSWWFEKVSDRLELS